MYDFIFRVETDNKRRSKRDLESDMNTNRTARKFCDQGGM